MSAVTKILIVVLTVLCIALSMASISFVGNTFNWKALAEDYHKEVLVADASQRQQMAARAAELAAARDAIQGLDERINQLEGELADVGEKNATLGNDIARLQGEIRQADALAQRLANELSLAQAARMTVEEQRKKLETRNIELEQRNIDLNGRVNELTTRVAVLNQMNRQQAQQISLLRSENESLAKQAGMVAQGLAPPAAGSGMSGVRPTVAAQHVRISGHVVAVDGRNVTVSVGSADQVRVGMVLVVTRDDHLYVGDIEITDVEPNLSAGKVVRSAEGLSPRQGDVVRDESQFVQSR